MRFIVKTLGCRTNIAESEWLTSQLLQKSYAYDLDAYDIAIVNSCTVTATADRKTRQMVKNLKRKNQNAHIILTGCGVRLKQTPHTTLSEVGKLCERVEDALHYILQTFPVKPDQKHSIASDTTHLFRSRATVKIQEGCNQFCSYCVIPHVRGRERSIPPEQIIATIQDKEKEGYHEIVLTGTNIGHYGRDISPNLTMNILVDAIVHATKNIRIRISSIEPESELSSLYNVYSLDRVCPHMHLCLQSGSDTILRQMKRGYSTSEFSKIIDFVRRIRPEIAVTTDVIVGFPGETDALFNETKDFIRKTGFAKLHVFPFSPRPFTAASLLGEHVQKKVILERSRILRDQSQKLEEAYVKQFIGTVRQMLVETKHLGLTDNYIEVVGDFGVKPKTCINVELLEHINNLQAKGRVVN